MRLQRWCCEERSVGVVNMRMVMVVPGNELYSMRSCTLQSRYQSLCPLISWTPKADYTTALENANVQILPSSSQDATVCDHLPPRVVFLVPGWLVPEGGGGKATSSQSPESGGGKPTPGTFGGGRSLCGDTGVVST